MFNNQEERGLPRDNHCVFNALSCAAEFLGDFYGTLLQRRFYPSFILVLIICQTCKVGSATAYLKWKVCSSMAPNKDVQANE